MPPTPVALGVVVPAVLVPTPSVVLGTLVPVVVVPVSVGVTFVASLIFGCASTPPLGPNISA